MATLNEAVKMVAPQIKPIGFEEFINLRAERLIVRAMELSQVDSATA